MARLSLENDVDSRDGAHEPSPDSTQLRVSRDVKHGSGIPPAREGRTRDRSSSEADQRLEQALSDVARTEANLQALVRGLKHLTAGATAALDSTRPLASEIDAIRGLVSRRSELASAGNDTEAKLQARVLELTKALEQSKADSRQEREKFIEHEDLFLIELLEDHDRRVLELEQRVAELTRQAGGPEVAELILQRDQARAYALQCELERDLAWRDLGVQTPAPRVGSSFPPPRDATRGSAIGSLKFRVNTPPPEPPAQTPTPPPAEVPAKPMTRRSAEYSLVGGETAETPTSTQRLPVR
jgi:hypothetical protein